MGSYRWIEMLRQGWAFAGSLEVKPPSDTFRLTPNTSICKCRNPKSAPDFLLGWFVCTKLVLHCAAGGGRSRVVWRSYSHECTRSSSQWLRLFLTPVFSFLGNYPRMRLGLPPLPCRSSTTARSKRVELCGEPPPDRPIGGAGSTHAHPYRRGSTDAAGCP